VSQTMAGQDELSELEAERDRLRAMIAYHNGPFYPMRSGFWQSGPQAASAGPPTPAWFTIAAIAIVCGIGILMVAGAFAGQIPLSYVLIVVVGLPLLVYISTRRVTLFGIPFRVGQLLALGSSEQLAGEPEALQRLADCEARIARLKEADAAG
jgi:hypothetical protein